MTATTVPTARTVGRFRHSLTAIWGVVSGVAPHVLHHVGPLAGAAVLAGTAGRVLFFFIGLAVATPMLIRLHRRFRTWWAPSIAVAIFVLAYTVSSLYLGPLITGDASETTDPASVTTTIDEHGH